MRNKLFPTIIVDDFFSDPDQLVDLAQGLKFTYDTDNRWPGQRSEGLHLIDADLFNEIGNRILQCFNLDNHRWRANAVFQLIDSRYGMGFVHDDYPVILTAITYLDRVVKDIDSGTSLYRSKSMYTKEDPVAKGQILSKLSKDEKSKLTESDWQNIQNHNDYYEVVLDVKNVYNRLFAFEGHLYHGANNFKNTAKRLTLVYFFSEIHIPNSKYPLTTFRA